MSLLSLGMEWVLQNRKSAIYSLPMAWEVFSSVLVLISLASGARLGGLRFLILLLFEMRWSPMTTYDAQVYRIWTSRLWICIIVPENDVFLPCLAVISLERLCCQKGASSTFYWALLQKPDPLPRNNVSSWVLKNVKTNGLYFINKSSARPLQRFWMLWH